MFLVVEDVVNIITENIDQNNPNKPSDEEDKIENNSSNSTTTPCATKPTNEASTAKSAVVVGQKGKKRMAQTMAANETRMEEAFQLLKKVAEPESTTWDECALYGELFATKLKSLDPSTRGIAMLEIGQLMFCHIHKQKYSFHQDPQSNIAYNPWAGQPMGHPSTPNQTMGYPSTSNQSMRYPFTPNLLSAQCSDSLRYLQQVIFLIHQRVLLP